MVPGASSLRRMVDPGRQDPSKHGDRRVTQDGPLGVLEVLPGGSGFVRRKDAAYTPGKDDIYVGARVIQKFDLRTGAPASLPASKPVPVYPTKVDDGILFLDLETTA